MDSMRSREPHRVSPVSIAAWECGRVGLGEISHFLSKPASNSSGRGLGSPRGDVVSTVLVAHSFPTANLAFAMTVFFWRKPLGPF